MTGRALDLGLGAVAAAQLGAAAWLVPAGDRVVTPGGGSLGDLCPLHALAGVPCPFCGMTRSYVALAHGEVGAAVRFHPAGPVLFAAMIALVAGVAIVTARGAAPLTPRPRVQAALGAIAALCLAIGAVHHLRS